MNIEEIETPEDETGWKRMEYVCNAEAKMARLEAENAKLRALWENHIDGVSDWLIEINTALGLPLDTMAKDTFGHVSELKAENASLKESLTHVCEACGNLGYATYSSIGAINNVVKLRMDAARYQKLVNRLAEAQRILSQERKGEGS